MTKIRTVKPELFRHAVLFEAEQHSHLPLRLAFIGLFSCCDREGRFSWEPRSLKLDVLPYDDIDFTDVLNALWAVGFIKKYVWQNKQYGYIPSWHQHQAINSREPASKLPAPDENTHVPVKEAFSTELQQAPIMQVQTPAAHVPLTVMHVQAHPLQRDASATYESVPADLIITANPITTLGKNVSTLHSENAAEPVPERVHATTLSNNSDLVPATHMHARATHGDASVAHVHAHLEVEMEMEMELEREVEKEKEMKVNNSLEVNSNIVAQTRRCVVMTTQVADIFNYWKTTWQHPHAVLDKKRYRLIEMALRQGYTVSQLCDAISGCAQTPHNCGENERGQRYDGLHIILRDADQIERFIHNCHNPPRPSNPADQLVRANTTSSDGCLNPSIQSVNIAQSAGLQTQVSNTLDDMTTKILSDTALTQDEIGLLQATRLPIYKMLNVQSAFAGDKSVMDLTSYADVIATDILFQYLDEDLSLLRTSVGSLQYPDNIMSQFMQGITEARASIRSSQQNAYSQITIASQLIAQTQNIEQMLAGQLSSQLTTTLKWADNLRQ